MSRLTSKEVRSLVEAYQQVYAPQITEEQILEEVEVWVDSLLEEGYDLSDYTWEEMYEAYIEEQLPPVPQVPSLGTMLQRARERQQRDDQFKSAFSAAASRLGVPTRGTPERKEEPRREEPRREPRRDEPAETRTPTPPPAPARPAAGAPTGKPAPAASTPARASSPANATNAQKIAGGMEVWKQQKAAGDTAAADKTGKMTSQLKYGDQLKPKTPNPLMKNMPGRNQAELDQIRGNAALSSISQSPSANKILSGTARSAQANQIGKASLDRSAASITAKPAPAAAAPAAKPAPAAATSPKPTTTTTSSTPAATPAPAAATPAKKEPPKREMALWHTDLYDLVKGYLLDEGYADSEESALAIMANMSEEWRESIVEAEVLAQKGGVPGTVQVKKTKEGGFLGFGGQTVSKPVPGTFKAKETSSSDAARYNVGVDRKFGGAAQGKEPTKSALSTQKTAQRSGHSGYMQVRDPGSLPNTGLPGKASPGRASDQNFAIGRPRNY